MAKRNDDPRRLSLIGARIRMTDPDYGELTAWRYGNGRDLTHLHDHGRGKCRHRRTIGEKREYYEKVDTAHDYHSFEICRVRNRPMGVVLAESKLMPWIDVIRPVGSLS